MQKLDEDVLSLISDNEKLIKITDKQSKVVQREINQFKRNVSDTEIKAEIEALQELVGQTDDLILFVQVEKEKTIYPFVEKRTQKVLDDTEKRLLNMKQTLCVYEEELDNKSQLFQTLCDNMDESEEIMELD